MGSRLVALMFLCTFYSSILPDETFAVTYAT